MPLVVSRQHHKVLQGTWSVPFTCVFCGHQGVALVSAVGAGTGQSPYLLGEEEARATAARRAAEDLARNIDRLALSARCPACSRQNRAELDRMRRNDLRLAMIPLAVAAVVLLVAPGLEAVMFATFGLIGAAMVFTRRRAAWNTDGSDVRVVSDAEAARLGLEQADTPAAEAHRWILAPFWRADLAGTLSEPFHGDLRFGLLRLDDDDPQWLERADVGGKTPGDCLERARDNLRRRSEAQVEEVRPGVWRGAWNDGFAAARLALPALFTGLHPRGALIAFTPSDDTLFLAGEEDEAGILTAITLATHHAREVLARAGVSGAFAATGWKLEGSRFVPWAAPEQVRSAMAPLRDVVGPRGWRAG